MVVAFFFKEIYPLKVRKINIKGMWLDHEGVGTTEPRRDVPQQSRRLLKSGL
jgi:hypothetical protein